MVSLEKSEKFQKEFNEWKIIAESMENMRAKAELENLLEQLGKMVKKIDIEHVKLATQHIMPDVVGESRQEIFNVRNKIQRIIKDYNSSIK